ALLPTLSAYREWVQWPAASLAPSRGRRVYRMKSTAERPLPVRGLRLLKSAKDPISVPVAPLQEASAQKSDGPTIQQALSLAGDALLVELKRLHERIGQDPDWALMRRAT